MVDKDYEFLARTFLFKGLKPIEIKGLINFLGEDIKIYKKGEIIYVAGTYTEKLGIVLLGSVFIEHDDIWGNQNILDKVSAGEAFAETYAILGKEPLMVSVVAIEATEVLFLDIKKLLSVYMTRGENYGILVKNLLILTAQKNLILSRRIFHTTAKTIRGRILSYLSFEATRNGKNEFDIPFNRTNLAAYLGVDRSALASEISKMQREGLIETTREHFILHGEIEEE